jgi:hypothetical protein
MIFRKTCENESVTCRRISLAPSHRERNSSRCGSAKLQCGQAPPQRRRKHYGGRIDGAGERGAIESSAGSVRRINLVACRRLIAAAALAANAIDDRTAAGELRYWPTLSRGQIDSRAVAASNCRLIARPVPMTARWGLATLQSRL